MYITVSDAWSVSEEGFPKAGTPAERLAFLVRYAVLAPSNHNSQPWRFRIDGDRLELRADRTRSLPVIDPQDRELTISCGAALFHLRAALRHFGYAGVVETFPEADDPDLLARVGLGEAVTPTVEDETLFHALFKRHTNRMAFADRKIPQPLLKALRSAVEQEGVEIHSMGEGEAREHLADLITQADHIQATDSGFRRELAHWLHHNGAQRTDGIPGSVFAMPGIVSYAGPFQVRTFDAGVFHTARDRQLVLGSPALAVLSTETDRPPDWLQTGQALGHLLLHAAAEGISASFLNAPIELWEMRSQVRAVAGASGFPQLILRLGYGPEVEPTPRRPAEEVIQG